MFDSEKGLLTIRLYPYNFSNITVCKKMLIDYTALPAHQNSDTNKIEMGHEYQIAKSADQIDKNIVNDTI